jgi:predicted nucleic acid-binding protein
MKSAVVDASVAVKWVVEEAFTDAAERLLTMGSALHAPSHWLAEATNAVVFYCVSRRLLTAEAAREKAAFLRHIPFQEYKLQELSRSATDLALALHASVHDTLYLALAVAKSVPCVTADRKFYDKVAADGRWSASMCWVADIPEG